jgi:hypothetical protein
VVVDFPDLREAIEERATKNVQYIRALAKTEMVQAFSGGDAAKSVLKPWVLEDQ